MGGGISWKEQADVILFFFFFFFLPVGQWGAAAFIQDILCKIPFTCLVLKLTNTGISVKPHPSCLTNLDLW